MDKVSRNFSGTPWHIEKVKGEGIRDNTNCVFNDKGRCSCIISCNHNNACVGKVVCEEFEYGIANKKVKIPMQGKTESLNASVATSIIVYEYVRRKIGIRIEIWVGIWGRSLNPDL